MSIRDNIEDVRAQIAAACARAGRDSSSVTLIAVSKTQSVSAIQEAANAGLQHFGENRVEEAEWKIPAVHTERTEKLNWHMIGHLQSRKVKDVLPLFETIHSLDSVRLAEKLSRQAEASGQTIRVLMEVNVSGEASKYGFQGHNWSADPVVRAEFMRSLETIAQLPAIQLQGLMTMAPIVETMEAARPVFAELAALRQAAEQETGVKLPELSMGMTDDFPVAIEEGATLIRIGRAIFRSP